MALSTRNPSGVRLRETCVVLAGGRGSRLAGLGSGPDGVNKHLLEVAGQPALLAVLQPVLATASAHRIVVVTRPDSVAAVERTLGDAGVSDITLRVQAQPRGTLDAVMVGAADVGDESFSVHYGDNIFAWRHLPDLRTALPAGTAACLYVVEPTSDWRRFAMVRSRSTASGLKAEEVVEKPATRPAAPAHCLTGMFRFDTASFWRYVPEVRISPRGELELTDLIEALVHHRDVKVVPIAVPWVDFGTERGLRAASGVLANRVRSR